MRTKARARVAKPQPLGIRLDIRPRDLAVRDVLTGRFLTREHIAAVLGIPDTGRLRKRLFQLVNETPKGYDAPLLFRPAFQKNAMYFYRPMIYGRTPTKDAKDTTEHALHRFMRSCAWASFKAAVDQHDGWEWLPFEPPSKPEPMTFHIDGGSYTPDDVFRWQTETAKRTYLFEADRGTKSIRGEKHSTIESKLRFQDELLRDKAYVQDLWGISSIKGVLTLTVTEGRMESMIDLVRERSLFPEKYLFRFKPHFDTEDWQIPPVMYDLFEEPWFGVNGPVFLNK